MNPPKTDSEKEDENNFGPKPEGLNDLLSPSIYPKQITKLESGDIMRTGKNPLFTIPGIGNEDDKTLSDYQKVADPLLVLAALININQEQIAREIASGYSFQVEAAKDLAQNGNYRVTITKETAIGLNSSDKVVSKIVIVGRLIGGIGLAFTVVDIAMNGVDAENLTDAAFGFIGFTPLAPLSIGYFGGKFIVQMLPPGTTLTPSSFSEREFNGVVNGEMPGSSSLKY